VVRCKDRHVHRWEPGDLIVRREITCGRPSVAWPVRVVLDSSDLLALFTPTGTPFAFSDLPYPNPEGRHPWSPHKAWEGHGVLMLQRPGDAYAVWHFWKGADRRFSCWYLNLQDPFRRSAIGIDSDDHELDLVVDPDGTWRYKDAEVLDQRVAEGRYTADQMVGIRRQGEALAEMLRAGATWWDHAWSGWQPPSDWDTPGPIEVEWEALPW
jgi:Protein of unknown function (DUF402)